jgi:hypothetical protein
MKYFAQLIKSYSRLHEAAQQLDPAAQQKALDYYAQANSKMVPLGGGNAPGIPVKELNGLIYKNREDKVIFNGFPGSRPAREINPQGADQSRENFNEFVSMLAAGAGGASTATREMPAPGVVDPAEAIPGSVLSVAYSCDGFPESKEYIAHVEGNPKNGAVRSELLDDNEAFPQGWLSGGWTVKLEPGEYPHEPDHVQGGTSVMLPGGRQ